MTRSALHAENNLQYALPRAKRAELLQRAVLHTIYRSRYGAPVRPGL